MFFVASSPKLALFLFAITGLEYKHQIFIYYVYLAQSTMVEQQHLNIAVWAAPFQQFSGKRDFEDFTKALHRMLGVQELPGAAISCCK